MEGLNGNRKIEGSQGFDAVVSYLATSGADLQSLESVINVVRQAMRNPELSNRAEANQAFDTLVQTLHDKGANLREMEENINAVRDAIKG